MYIATKTDDVIFLITDKFTEDGDYYLFGIEEMHIPKQHLKEVYEIKNIPEYVEAEKYCYTEEKGFYKNEKYIEQYTISDRINALEDVVNMLILEGNE